MQSDFKGSEIVLQDTAGNILVESGSGAKSDAHTAMLKSPELKSDRPTISGILAESSFAESAYFVTVPVTVFDTIRYYIVARMPVQRLANLIADQNIDAGYFVSIADQNGLLLARSA